MELMHRHRMNMVNFRPRDGFMQEVKKIQNQLSSRFPVEAETQFTIKDVNLGFMISVVVHDGPKTFSSEAFVKKGTAEGLDRLWQVDILDQLSDDILLQAQRY